MTGILSGPSTDALRALGTGNASQIVSLCTPDGFRLVALGENGQPVETPAGTERCDWCQSFGASLLPVPPSDGSCTRYDTGHTLRTSLDEQTVRGNAASGSYVTRAPPFEI
ncbi:hypothetical protein NUH88_14255 [Nisaea acidiphila]|uniref:Uncharacterized protein n=1 Tax=Nisaea acidiphila TaxID=1862145 RepID=A0A9J7ALP6_9PROT|nr:hypothetical protein [Nisaea acidiphila]UUX48571.1 hypothetical protein NUH88_14255 [Nisaea acidiphila]